MHIKRRTNQAGRFGKYCNQGKICSKKYLLKHTGFFSKQMKVTDTQQIQQNVQTCHSLIQKAKQRINCKAMNSNDK